MCQKGVKKASKRCQKVSKDVIIYLTPSRQRYRLVLHLYTLTLNSAAAPAAFEARSAESNFKYKIQNTKYKIQDTRYKIQNTKYKIQNTKTLFFYDKYETQGNILNLLINLRVRAGGNFFYRGFLFYRTVPPC